jgi:hypothetical protein
LNRYGVQADRSYVFKWEGGRVPPPDVVWAYARLARVEPGNLLAELAQELLGKPDDDDLGPLGLQKSTRADDSVTGRRLTEDERTMLDLPDRGLLISAASLAWQLLKRPQDREAFALAIVDLARRMASGIPSTGTEGKGDE